MVFVPLLGLIPFFGFQLLKSKKIFINIFLSGILIGSLPTIISFYFSYKQFGLYGITSLFEFAKKQAIGEYNLNNLLFIPLNYLYLTFPVGLLLIILLIFTRSNNNTKYPLLTFYYPLISLSFLLCMSKSYPHYYLFLAPPLSILFSTKILNYTFRYTQSKNIIKYLMSLLMIFICCIIFSLIIFYKEFLLDYSFRQTLLLYMVSTFLVVSFIYSIRYLICIRNNQYDLIKFFKIIIISQYISLSILYNFGIIGNPNYKTKLFLNDNSISSILKDNTIYLYNVDSKIQTLLSYYLPSSKVVTSSDDIFKLNYIITSDVDFTFDNIKKNIFKSIKKINNHSLLVNISK